MRTPLKAVLMAMALSAPALAADPCADLPRVAHEYLKAHPGWSVVRFSDLLADDQALWKQSMPERCPGFATVDFDGSGNPFTALALLNASGGKRSEMVVIFRHQGDGLEQHILAKPYSGGFPDVIYVMPPGKAKEWDSPKEYVLKHQSLVLEHMEASAVQFYFAKGKFRTVQISD